VVNECIGALAQLNLGRAYEMKGCQAQTKYQDFSPSGKTPTQTYPSMRGLEQPPHHEASGIRAKRPLLIEPVISKQVTMLEKAFELAHELSCALALQSCP
jgi:hypothetical protein